MSFPPARSRAGFVTACQQVLALGVVLAALTPAAGVVSLDVVGEGRSPGPGASATPASARAATVPTGVVDAEVEEYQLSAPEGARVAPGSLRARTSTGSAGAVVTSDVLPVDGFGTVGVTWAPGQGLDDDVQARVRMLEDGAWSRWRAIAHDTDHGPDPASLEARTARPGTDALVVGAVDDVQVRVTASEAAPSDLRLAVIAPGEPTASERARPTAVPAPSER